MKFSSSLGSLQQEELWHACAGPLVSLPPVGCPVVYFPQGHIEQVAAATNEVVDSSNLPSLPPQLVCQLHNVTMHTDEETDEVYAQMTLQTLSPEDEQKGVCVAAQAGGMRSKQPTNYFHKTLTASDTSTHGCCSIPRRAAEKVFPSLDYSQEPPAQELVAKDLHGIEWKFRHTFRGQPRRHLLTIGWTPFVNTKRLVAGDTVTFIWYGFNELLLGIRRVNRQQRVASSGSMHVALVAAHAAATYSPFTVSSSSGSMHVALVAAHAAATYSPFTVSYFPRACHSEFVIPLAKYVSAVHHVRLLGGMRFRMLFETPESTVRRYMGKIVGIGDVDPVRWPNSHWRSVKVIWDEPSAGQRQSRVSPWEMEPLPTFPLYPPHSPFCIKQPWTPGLASHLFGQSRDDDLSLSSQLTILQSYGDTTLGLQPVPNLDTIRSAVDAASWMQQKIHSLMQADPRHAMDDNAAPGVDLQTGSAAHDFPLSPSPAARLQLQHTEAAAAADLARRSTLALQSSGDEIQPGDGDGNLSQPPQTFLQIAQLVNQMRGQYSQPEPHLQYSLPPPLLAPPPPLDDACSSILQTVSSNSLTAATSYCPTDLGLFHDQSSQDILSLDPSFHATLEPLPPVAPIFFL